MYKLPTENETVAHIIARGTLGVYAAKFDLVGTEVNDGDNWKHTLYDATLYRLDKKHVDGRYPNIHHSAFRQGMGCSDPTTSRYAECLWLDMDIYANISENNTATELDAFQNYVNEFGYDSKDPKWFTKVIKTVRELKDEYPELLAIFGEDFAVRLDEARDAIFVKTDEEYDQSQILELICVDPDEDELEEIEKGDYDYDEIRKRYADA